MTQENQWFYALNEQRHGPVGTDEICELIKNGTLHSDSLMWKQGMTEWLALRYCPEFAEILFTVPPKVPQEKTTLQVLNQYDSKTPLYIAYSCFLLSIVLTPILLFISGIISLVANDGQRPVLHKAHFTYICTHSWIAFFLGLFSGFMILFSSIITLILAIIYIVYVLNIGITGLMRLQENKMPKEESSITNADGKPRIRSPLFLIKQSSKPSIR